MFNTALFLTALAGCLDTSPTTSTAEQAIICDPFCDTDTRYLMQAQSALNGWMSFFCQSCSSSCSTAQYPNGITSAICDAIDSDGWLVGQCWVDYRSTGTTGSGCAAIQAE